MKYLVFDRCPEDANEQVFVRVTFIIACVFAILNLVAMYQSAKYASVAICVSDCCWIASRTNYKIFYALAVLDIFIGLIC